MPCKAVGPPFAGPRDCGSLATTKAATGFQTRLGDDVGAGGGERCRHPLPASLRNGCDVMHGWTDSGGSVRRCDGQQVGQRVRFAGATSLGFREPHGSLGATVFVMRNRYGECSARATTRANAFRLRL